MIPLQTLLGMRVNPLRYKGEIVYCADELKVVSLRDTLLSRSPSFALSHTSFFNAFITHLKVYYSRNDFYKWIVESDENAIFRARFCFRLDHLLHLFFPSVLSVFYSTKRLDSATESRDFFLISFPQQNQFIRRRELLLWEWDKKDNFYLIFSVFPQWSFLLYPVYFDEIKRSSNWTVVTFTRKSLEYGEWNDFDQSSSTFSF